MAGGTAGLVDVSQLAVCNVRQRHDLNFVNLLRVPPAFVIKKEKKPFFFDGPAKIGAKLIAHQVGAWHATGIIEEGVGFGDRGAIVFMRGAVPIIRAALGGDDRLRAAAAAVCRSNVRYLGAEFLHRLDGIAPWVRNACPMVKSVASIPSTVMLF